MKEQLIITDVTVTYTIPVKKPIMMIDMTVINLLQSCTTLEFIKERCGKNVEIDEITYNINVQPETNSSSSKHMSNIVEHPEKYISVNMIQHAYTEDNVVKMSLVMDSFDDKGDRVIKTVPCIETYEHGSKVYILEIENHVIGVLAEDVKYFNNVWSNPFVDYFKLGETAVNIHENKAIKYSKFLKSINKQI